MSIEPFKVEANLFGHDIKAFIDGGRHLVEIQAQLARENDWNWYEALRVRSTVVEGAEFWLIEIVGTAGQPQWHAIYKANTVDTRITRFTLQKDRKSVV